MNHHIDGMYFVKLEKRGVGIDSNTRKVVSSLTIYKAGSEMKKKSKRFLRGCEFDKCPEGHAGLGLTRVRNIIPT